MPSTPRTGAPATQTTASQTTTAALDAALSTVRRNISLHGDLYPDDTTTDDRYPIRPAVPGFAAGENRGWTTSFWPGQQWLAWELTGDEEFRAAALRHAADFAARVRGEKAVSYTHLTLPTNREV